MSSCVVEIKGATLRFENCYMMLDQTMLLADLHLGKTMHFRKAGLPIPASARNADQSELMRILNEEHPEQLIVLGDLFHSVSNSECEELAIITSQFPQVQFTLVLGNHDFLSPSVYRSMNFETCKQMHCNNLILTHEPLAQVDEDMINVHGHIHPGIRMRGKGLQAMTFPCFHLSKSHLCLPAFGALTGLVKRKAIKGDQVFGIFEGEVRRVF